MDKDMLSQDEIDALLTNIGGGDERRDMGEIELEALREIIEPPMEKAGATIGTLLGAETSITSPRLNAVTSSEAAEDGEYLWVTVPVDGGVSDRMFFLIEPKPALALTGLVLGEEAPGELTGETIDVLQEVFNQLSAGFFNNLGKKLGENWRPKTLTLEKRRGEPELPQAGRWIEVGWRFSAGEELRFRMRHYISQDQARYILDSGAGEPEPEKSQSPQPPGEEARVGAQRVTFDELDRQKEKREESSNIDLLLDIPLELTVELGRTRRTVREILSFGPGAVVELDKLAGEPVDLLVNGKLLARGEVVVIDENFGVRITNIISPEERVRNLG